MKVLLVYANGFMDNLVSVGVSLLSACLKKAGHETKLFDTTCYRREGKSGDEARMEILQFKTTNLEEYGVHEKETDMVEDFKKMIDDYKPGLIAVSVLEMTYLLGLKILNSIKDLKIPKLMGGVHVTMAGADVIKEEAIDIACIGEGENAIVELANRLEKNEDYSNIPNLWVKKDGKVIRNPVGPLIKLDDLPDQDWSIYDKSRFYKPMGGKVWKCGIIEYDRGCPHRCAFCSNASLQDLYKGHGSYPRFRSVEKFIAEFKDKKKRYNLEYLFMGSELFFQKEDRFNKFYALYKDIQIPFWVQTRPETVTKERIIKLEELGCEGLSIGIEHGSDEFRRKVLNRFVPDDRIVKAFEVVQGSTIRVTSNNIVGYPNETREHFFDSVEINRKINSDFNMMNILTPYRGTKVWEMAVEQGLISKDKIAGDYRIDDGLDMPQLSREEVKGLRRTFPLYVKFPKEMWPEIKKAEKFDEEGNAAFERLGKIYKEKYMFKGVDKRTIIKN